MKHFASKLPFILLMILLILPCGAHSSTDGPLLFVGNQDYEPMAYLENGTARGFYVDLTEALSRNIGRTINVQLMNWHEAQQMVQDGRADAALSISSTEERKQRFDFSNVVLKFEFSLFLKVGTLGIHGLNDLDGKTVVVYPGSYPHQLLQTKEKIKLLVARDHAEGFKLLREGKADAFATDKWVGSYYIQKNGITGITLAPEPFAVQESAIAVKKGNVALLADINRGLKQLHKTGQFQQIYKKWSGQKIIFTTEAKKKVFLIRVAAGVAVVALIFLAVWVIVLRRQITRRVKAEVERNRYFDLSLDMLCIAGFDGKFRELNPAWQRTLGWRIDEIKQAPWLSFVHPEDQAASVRAGERLSRGEAVLGFENRYRCKDGSYKWLSWNSYPLPEEKLMFGAVRDITERKKSEEALRQSEEKYRSIVDNIVEGMCQSTPDGKYLSVNRAQARLYGYDSSEEMIEAMTDISTQLYVDAQDHRRITGLMEKFDQVINFEFQARRKDGSTLWVSQNARAVRNAQGKILYYEGTNIDITERKTVELELARAYQLNKQIIASVAEGIVILDRNLCYRMWNPFMEKITGIRESDLIGKKIGDYFAPIKAYGIEETLNRILSGEILHFPPFPYDIPQSGKKGWAEVACRQQRNEKNEVIGVIVSVHDVTEKTQIEERLQRAEKMEAIGLLAGGVAHDLNNVIGISIGYSEMMLDDLEPDSPLRSHVESIMQATERASAIVQDMLTMARRGVPVSKVINLNTIVTDFLEEPGLAALQALHPNVDIKTVLSPDLLNISGSPVHLKKTVMNLITNAAEAIRDHGVICVSTQNIHLDRPVRGYDSFTEGDYAVLSVSDTGEGIPAENLPHIFEPFYTKKVMGRSGTGLGLAVVWGAVKDHNGYIDVKSQPGQGTIFSLYFPVVREELTAGAEFTDRLSYLGKGETILVVDDVPEQRELATRLLAKLDYLPASVGSGEEAVEFLKKSKADLVVLDMIMDPGIDGLETYRRILEVRPGQKAIIVSGFAETERVAEAQRLGAGAYVKKPYLTETLGTAVRQELDRKGTHNR